MLKITKCLALAASASICMSTQVHHHEAPEVLPEEGGLHQEDQGVGG